MSCSDVFGNTVDWSARIIHFAGIPDNFPAHPEFCDGAGLYTISSESPCAPGVNAACGLVGAGPVACGPISLPSESWARVKSRYRR